jgi:iron complex transport system substrate-binding protein
MKTNTILVGITIGLLLLTLPAAASDYTLGIFGNANEDDTINMQDVTYTELIILEYRDRTELADAKYDGEIDILDMTQIALIILEREKELTILDSIGRIVTIDMPVERVVALSTSAPAGTYRILGAMDKIVGINRMITGDPFYPELQDKPAVGWPSPDYEAIVELNPDLIIAGTSEFYYFEILEKMDPLGIEVVLIDCGGKPSKYFAELRTLGMILGATERAEEYIDFSQSYLDLVDERIQELSPEEKKTVYFEFIDDYAIKSRSDDVIHRAGGVP